MRVTFYASSGKKFDEALAAAFGRGVTRAGDHFAIENIAKFDAVGKTDVAVLAGVKGHSKRCFDAHLDAGRHAIILDKGYTRLRGGPLGTLYWRTSVDAFQPHAYFRAVPRPPDRWAALEALGVEIPGSRPRRADGTVLFAGSSQKYCDWHGLGPATRYATKILHELKDLTKKELVYRPKPSWGDAVPIPGFRYSADGEKYIVELAQAFLVVTFGSNAAFEALLNGVPALVLGDGIARPLARHKLDDVDDPLYPTETEVRQLAADVAYCQFTLDEMADGLAWRLLKPVVETSRPKRKK